jgi:molecular chaperone Hsp33
VHIAAAEPYSLFVTGNTGEIDDAGVAKGYIVGHILTDHIRRTEVHSIHAQFTNRGQTFRSMVPCDSDDIRKMVEQFYAQSEQHPFRIELSSTSDTAIGLVALPEYDEEWIQSVELNYAAESPEVTRNPMRTCEFAFVCDCSPEKLMPFFRSLSQASLDDLYGEDQELQISCPRCGKQFEIKRSEFAPEQ